MIEDGGPSRSVTVREGLHLYAYAAIVTTAAAE
jgi:hypothetical protein